MSSASARNEPTNSGDPTAPEALRRARLVAIVLAATMFMVVIDATVLLTALPRMAQDFDVPVTMLSATVTIYILVTAVLLPISNWIGQRFGTRRVYMIAIFGFILASIGAGLSQNLAMFLVMRMCQAAFATLMVPVGNIVLLTITPKHYLVTAMTISSTPALIAPVLGPPLGGFITTFLDWRWVFFLNVPTGLIALLAALRFVPNIHSAERTPFDGKGFALTSGFLCLLIAGFDRIGARNSGWEVGVPLLVASMVLGRLAWRHARTAEHPIVPLKALRYASFRVSTISGGSLVRIAFMATSFILPLMLQIGLGLSAFQAGMLLLAQNGGDLLLKAVASKSLRLIGFRSALASGAIMIGASMAACALLTREMPFWLLFTIMFGIGMARSIHMTAMMALRFADVPQSDVGGATVLGNLANSVSQALAISCAAALLNLLSGGALTPSLEGFRIAMLIFGLLAMSATPIYMRLAADTGAALLRRQPIARPILQDEPG